MWTFASNCGIDFNGTSNVCRPSIHQSNSSTSVCDSSGQLLFYSDNLSFRNKNDSIMPNSINLAWVDNNTVVANQGVIAVPNPANLNQFYSFNMSVGVSGSGHSDLYYNIIDMTLDNGLGDLVVKNQFIDDDFVEKVAATRHCNGRDWWIVTHKCSSNTYYSYLLDINGFNPIPVISNAGLTYTDTIVVSNNSGVFELVDSEYEGALKISPNGKLVGMSNILNIEVLNFDNLSGTVYNSILVDSSGVYNNNVLARSYYSCAFSSNSKYFYAGLSEAIDSSLFYNANIYQYDLQLGSSSEILISKTPIVTNNSEIREYPSLQIGPDNKIYSIGTIDYIPIHMSFLYQINQPDLPGLQSDFQVCPFQCDTFGLRWLPVFYDGIFTNHQRAALKIPLCNTANTYDSIPFFDSLLTTTHDYLWDFGDPASGALNTSTDDVPMHYFSSVGTYNVTLTLQSECNPITISHQVNVTQVPPQVPIISLNSIYLESTPATQYQWYINNVAIAVANNQTFTPVVNGNYTVMITDSNNCTATSNVFNFTNVGLQINNPNNFTVFPNPAKETLHISNPNKKQTQVIVYSLIGTSVLQYQLSNASETIDISSLANGIYILKIDNQFNQKIVINK